MNNLKIKFLTTLRYYYYFSFGFGNRTHCVLEDQVEVSRRRQSAAGCLFLRETVKVESRKEIQLKTFRERRNDSQHFCLAVYCPQQFWFVWNFLAAEFCCPHSKTTKKLNVPIINFYWLFPKMHGNNIVSQQAKPTRWDARFEWREARSCNQQLH